MHLTVFLNTRDDGQSLWWHFHSHSRLELEFKDKDVEVEFHSFPSLAKTKKKIKFIVQQKITKKHPEIPKDMDTRYDFDREVVLYGKNKRNFWGLGPREFVVHGELKASRYLKRVEVPPQINGQPDIGYKREELYAMFSLGNIIKQPSGFESIEVHLPEYNLNGKKVVAEKLKFKLGSISSNQSNRCNYWQSKFPGDFRIFLHRFNPFDT